MLGFVKDFVFSLKRHIKKDEVLEELRITRKELESYVIPSCFSFMNFFTSSFKSSEGKQVNDVFIESFKKDNKRYAKTPNFTVELHERLNSMLANIEILEKHIVKEMPDDVVTDAINSRVAMFVHAIENISYISRKIQNILTYITIYESSSINRATESDLMLTPAQMSDAKSSVFYVAHLIKFYSLESSAFEARLRNAKDVIISTTVPNDKIEFQYDAEDIDTVNSPLRMNFARSPIFHIRMMIAEWQVSRYKRAEEVKKMLEYRLNFLKNLEDGENNPRVLYEIERVSMRIQKLEAKMNHMEESIGGGDE